MLIEDFLFTELRQRKPVRILAEDEAARKLAQEFAASQAGCTLVEYNEPADLALAFLANDKEASLVLIGLLKQKAPVVLVAAHEESKLDFKDFLSFGMQRLVEADERGRSLYLFDLHTYKPAPDWLNPRFWAHPELWKP